ncbi:MAG: hypothetical protein HGB15_03385 [Chlorobaculum sp.]|nr:hypothetical protein [Chlorobaculum sp.]
MSKQKDDLEVALKYINRAYQNYCKNGGEKDINATGLLRSEIVKRISEINDNDDYDVNDMQRLRSFLMKKNILKSGCKMNVIKKYSGVAGKSRVYFVKIISCNESYYIAKFDEEDRLKKENDFWRSIKKTSFSIHMPREVLCPEHSDEDIIIYPAAHSYSTSGYVWSFAELIRNQLSTNTDNCLDALKKIYDAIDLLHKYAPGNTSILRWSDVFTKLSSKINDIINYVKIKMVENDWQKKETIYILSKEYINPIKYLREKLDNNSGGIFASRIHGDLNLTNVLVSLSGKMSPEKIFIIDMAESRIAMPSLFDYVRIETELWTEVFANYVDREAYTEGEICEMYVSAREMLDGYSKEMMWSDAVLTPTSRMVQDIRDRVRKINSTNIPDYRMIDYYNILYFTHVYSLSYETVKKSDIKIYIALIGASLALKKINAIYQGVEVK